MNGVGWPKGRPHSESHKEKIRLSLLGRQHTEEAKRKMSEIAIGENNPFFGKHHSELTKSKMSKVQRGENHPNFGKHHKEETLKKISQGHKGKHHSEQTIKKMSEAHRGEKNHNFGKHLPEEQKQKLRIAASKRIDNWPFNKPSNPEIKLHGFLNALSIPFMSQRWMVEIEHRYPCDIFVPSLKLVIEADGNYWHKYPVGREKDHIHTQELQEAGFRVLRLWEHEIRTMEIDEFKERLESC